MVGLDPAEDPSRTSSSQITRNLRAWQRQEEVPGGRWLLKLESELVKSFSARQFMSKENDEKEAVSHLRAEVRGALQG